MICKILFPRKGKLYSDICPPNKKPPVWVVLQNSGASKGARTLDLNLGKVAL